MIKVIDINFSRNKISYTTDEAGDYLVFMKGGVEYSDMLCLVPGVTYWSSCNFSDSDSLYVEFKKGSETIYSQTFFNKKIFHVIDSSGNLTQRNLFDLHKQGKLDTYSYLYYENMDCYNEGAIGNDYEREGCIIEEGDVVVDIGANIGMFVARASLKKAKHIYAFEPYGPTFTCLMLNKPKECHAFNLAISDRVKKDTIYVHSSESNLGGATVYKDALLKDGCSIVNESPILAVDMNTLFDSGLLGYIDFLKIDTEGEEVKILNSMKDSMFGRISKIAVEYHMPVNSQENLDRIVNRLNRLGYKSLVIKRSDGRPDHYLAVLHFWKEAI